MDLLKDWFDKLRWQYRQRHSRRYQNMSVPEIFSTVYKENIWGGEKGTFYSGTGTSNPNTIIYMERLVDFIRERSIRSVVEVGCGDFTIMQKVMEQLPGVHYTGLDVVPDLIAHHNGHYAGEHIKFTAANAITDVLPEADLIIIRQVLQHLDNAAITKVLEKVKHFPYASITEHLPITKGIKPNVDKVTGPNIRMKWNSGVFIDQPPFSLPNTSTFMEYRMDDPVKKKLVPAVMRTYLYQKEPA